MGIKWQTIIATIINLVILVFILRYFFWDKIRKVIEDRQKAINERLASADRARSEAAKLKAENEKALKDAYEEGNRIIAAKKAAAEEVYSKIVESAQEEAENLKLKANEQIELDINTAQLTLKEQVIDLATLLSNKVLEGSLDEARHRAIIDEYIEKVGI